MDSTLEKITAILVDQLGVDATTISMDTDIQADLGADSVSIMELIVEIESEFDVEVPEEKLLVLRTVGDIVTEIDKLN